jgi:hypothetical protein
MEVFILKKILTSLALATLLTTNLFSETLKENKTIDEIHQVFITNTNKIDLTNSKKEFIFFGTIKELQNEYTNIQKSIAERGLDSTIKALEHSKNSLAKSFLEGASKNLGAGMAFGVLLGLAEPYIMSAYADEQFVLIYDFTNSQGQKTRIKGTFVASNFDDEETIKTYLENKIMNEVY